MPRNFNRSFTRCIAAAKIPAITVHETRKTCGSLLAALDVHPRFAMQILQHSKIAVTIEAYTEVPSAATREALEKLGQWLDSDSQTSLLHFAAAPRPKTAGCKITTGR